MLTGSELLWWRGQQGPLQMAFTSVAAGNLSLNIDDQGLGRRRYLEQAIGLEPGALRFLNQVHSADVIDAENFTETTADSQGSQPTGDAWVSAHAQQPLAIMVADCLPVLFAATNAAGEPMSAAAHAGRPGLLAGVLENTVLTLRTAGAEQISAWIGPGACGRCYEVPESMQVQLSKDRPALRSHTSWDTPALDLRAEAQAVLAQQEVKTHSVTGCTMEDPTLFSHRAWQQQGRAPGRIAGLIWRDDTVAP